MDPKELKQFLKEAKECLKKNDNIGAAKACKTILKKEPEHYQANLYLGTAFREQGKFQQALEAYKKAVQLDGTQVYAWQGVISVYEKQNIKNHPDLLDAYKRVATHFEKDDKQKYIENTLKLANILISQQDGTKALKVIGRLAKSAGLNLEIAQLLVLLLNNTTSETRSPDEDELYTNALEVLVTQTPQPAEETYRKYFSQLYRNKYYEKLAQRCIAIEDQWNYYYSPMEWICRLYLESQIEPQLLSKLGGIEKITDKESFSGYVSHYCPSLDVPVYNNKTGNLYKSIFCARCHYVPYHEILPMNHEIRCTSNFTSWADFEEFSLRSTYQRGKLRWDDPNNSSVQCTLYVKQLQPDVIKSVVPNVRFCFTDANEECSLDLTSEENLITYNLCFSYTLVVVLQNGYMFEWYKNPHCAKCDNQSIDIKRTPTCHRPPPRGGLPGIGTRLFAGEAGPVGINIFFHFSLDMDDGYVGYTSKCEEDEILDFIRNKCVPVICQRGYELNDGQCEKTSNDSTSNDDSNQTSVSPSNDTNSPDLTYSSNSSEPCFLIIFHTGEYHQLANGSLAVNKSGNSGILLFQAGEYQKYEGDEGNMSMSICAKHVDKTFESSFAPALSYISNILLVLSVLCCVAHVLLYLILPKMRNLPGNNLLCLTSCLLISHFIFLTFINTSNRTVCVIASMSMHYFLLSGFVWMYVMSFDIWRTFSSEFIVRRYSGDSVKTFIKYSLFAWILPLFIVTLAALTDFAMPDSWLEDSDFGPLMKKLRPLYGHNNTCWIGQRLSLFVFFAFPVGLIILCNLILFALTAVTIWVQNKEGNRFINGNSTSPNSSNKSRKDERLSSHGVNKVPLHASNSGSTKKSEKIRFKLYLKLALIMGLTWILGLFSGFAQGMGWEWLWYPFVIFNGLQGTFIFVAFDCKAKIWNMVKERFGWRNKKIRKGFSGEEGSSESRSRHTRTTTLSSILSSSSGKSGELTASNSEKVLVK